MNGLLVAEGFRTRDHAKGWSKMDAFQELGLESIGL